MAGHLQRQEGAHQRQRDAQGNDQRSAYDPQKIKQHHARQHQPQQQVALHQGDGAADVQRSVETQLQGKPLGRKRPGIQLGNHRLETIEQLHGVGAVAAIQADVVGRIAVAPGKAVALHEAGLDAGHIAQIDRLLIAPANDQLTELVDAKAAGNTDRVLTPADIGEATGDVGGATQRPGYIVDGDTHAREPVGIDVDRNFALAAGFQAHLGDAGYTRQPGLNNGGHQIFIGGDIGVNAVGAKQLQGGRGIVAGGPGPSTHNRFVGVGGQGRRLVEIGDDVDQPLLHVPANLEVELDIALVPGDGTDHAGHTLDIAEHTLLALDDLFLDFLGCGGAPAGEDEDLRGSQFREQLDGQAVDRQYPKTSTSSAATKVAAGLRTASWITFTVTPPAKPTLVTAV